MFPNIPLLYIFGPALIAAVIIGRIIGSRINVTNSVLQQSIVNLRLMVIQIGILLVILYMALPSTSLLSLYGYPENVTSIDTSGKILQYLQTNNRAIVRTTEVLHWTLFLIAWGFLSSIYIVIKAYNDNNTDKL